MIGGASSVLVPAPFALGWLGKSPSANRRGGVEILNQICLRPLPLVFGKYEQPSSLVFRWAGRA